jgi:hypothetical protein
LQPEIIKSAQVTVTARSQYIRKEKAKSQIRRQPPRLLRCIRRYSIHEGRRQHIVGLQPHRPELGAHVIHPLRVEPLLDDGRHKRRELGFLPALVFRQLDVDEIQSLERVVLLDATEQVHAALLARMSLDHGALVDDLELVAVGGHGHFVLGDHSDDGEEGAGRLPALGTSTGMVVSHVAAESHLDFVAATLAVQLSAGEVGIALGDAVVDQRMKRGRHVLEL